MESEASHQHPKHIKLTNPILPSELVTEILLRLPVKSLLRFKFVSELWLALISSPEFVKTHLSLSANNKDYTLHKVMMSSYPQNLYNLKECTLRSLFYDSVTEAFDLDCPFRYDHVSFIGSVNGLICLLIPYNDYFISNPSIRKYKKLPNTRPSMQAVYRMVSSFGYDELHDDYKVVVCFYSNSTNQDSEVKIYSLKSDSWKNVDKGGRVLANGRGMFVNGKLHWATSDNYYSNHNSKIIISFDLADEKWETVEQPYYGEGIKFLKVGVLNSDLSVSSQYKSTHIDVWIMTEYGVKESWMKILTIKYRVNPPFFMSNRGEILVMVKPTFRIYNMKVGSFEIPKFINFDGHWKAEIYHETLVCPFYTRRD